MMLTKLIRQPKLGIITNLMNYYHESNKFESTIRRSGFFTNGYLTEDKWFQRCDKELRNEKVVSGGVITDQSVRIECNDIQFKTWNKFSEIEEFDKRILDKLLQMGHNEMTPIQKNTFDILNKQLIDFLGSAETGSGKTIAFLSPIFNNILRSYPADMMGDLKRSNGNVQYPLLLVLAPTRELVEQIAVEARKLLHFTNLRVSSVIGGVNPSNQLMDIRRGCHSLIATPGRLIDFMNRGYISLKHCNKFVLDEADRMLDMGFEPQVREIVNQFDLPKENERNTSMFSATFPDSVIDLAQSLMKRNYGTVMVGRTAGSNEPCIPDSIKQNFTLSDNGSLFQDCFHYLENNNKKTIVFCNKKADIDRLARFAYKMNLEPAILHGDLSQSKRQHELHLFKKNQAKVLMATSIAARGIDVSDVECVVNLGLPMSVDDYVHRVGRCGRLGRPGESMTFVLDEDLNGAVSKDLVKMLHSTKKEIPDFLREMKLNKSPVLRRENRDYQWRNNFHRNRNDRYMR